jgi:hypothetical protein
MDAQAQIATLPAGPPETSIEPRTIRPELLPLPPDDDSQPHSSTYSLRTLNVHRAPTASMFSKSRFTPFLSYHAFKFEFSGD